MKLWMLILSLCLASPGRSASYHVDAVSGLDSNAGTVPEKPWKSLSKASSRTYLPGDSLLLKRGASWKGSLKLSGKGSPSRPILLGAYGSGARPRIDAGGRRAAVTSEEGIACWKIKGLELTNSEAGNPLGKKNERADGIFFKQSEPSASLAIEDCVIHDTEGEGIKLMAMGKQRAVFSQVRIEHCEIYNAWCGISFDAEMNRGDYHLYFPGFHISGVSVHDTGSDGIVPFFGDRGVVEHCRAWRTGMGYSKRSPVAIWLAFDRGCVIQFCEAWDNHSAGQSADGGGFDIDGGSTDCVLQYNYSHGNEGAGFLICSFDPKVWPTRGSVCRYNLSVNDGLSNGYAAINIWQADDSRIYNNTCVTTGTSPLRFMEKTKGNVFANNLFVENSGKALPLVRSDEAISANSFKNNLFYSVSGKYGFEVAGGKLEGLESFQKSVGGTANLTGNPQFFDLHRNFYLKAASPARGRGLILPDRGSRDYFGNPLVPGQAVDLGFAQTK